MAKTVLIVGATRGLGASLTSKYAEQGDTEVYATARSKDAPKESRPNVHWITQVDLSQRTAGPRLVDSAHTPKKPYDIVIITAGYFPFETFDKLDWDAQVQTYLTSAIGPAFVVQSLAKSDRLSKGSKVILVTSESGSITLRHESEGGGNYAHHASKAAENMVGKLLSLDLKEKGVAVANVHPGFMRTEMTKNVGFDKFWDEGGAVTPDEAAKSLIDWIGTFDITKTGEYWAPRGPADIGTAEPVLGPKDKLSTPLKLPW